MYALIDCNNFFVSCERLFRPDLANKIVVVLSNNDGCVISRSQEAKDLGIKMGEPWFLCKERFKTKVKNREIVAFSTNFPLYGDISERINQVIASFSPYCEKYSIDETFIRLKENKDLTLNAKELLDEGHKIRNTILKWTGMPVGVGIGETKTLSKLAQYITKSFKKHQGVCNLSGMNQEDLRNLLQQIDIGEIWGIGRKLAPRLRNLKTSTAYDLKTSNPVEIGKRFSKNIAGIIYELNGIQFQAMTLSHQDPKQLLCSRTFAKPVTDEQELQEIVCYLTAHVASKLRKHQMTTTYLKLYLAQTRSGKYKSYRSATFGFPQGTSDIRELNKAVKNVLGKLYKSNTQYKKAGVTVFNLTNSHKTQLNIFEDLSKNKKSNDLMQIIDSTNNQYGYGTLKVLAEGLQGEQMRRATMMSPKYTTALQDLYSLQ